MSLIKLKKIKKYYGNGTVTTKALKGIDLLIEEGEFVAIMGPSGSGKSTLMNIMGFLDVATSGVYEFESNTITTYDENSLAEIRNKKIGFIFQAFHLLPRYTALDNVKLPMIYANTKDSEQDKRAKTLLREVGLEQRMLYKPNQLSGGEQQRVAIARALANNPKIILADEPSGNLDSKASGEVMKILKKLNKNGNTIILVTHDKNIANYARRIITMKDGFIDSDIQNKSTK